MIRIFVSLLLAASALFAEPADWIWSARYVVTMDAGRRVIENGAVAVRGSDIAAAGARAKIDKRFQAKQRLDRPDAILIPGLINAHTHAPMSLLRGIADDLRLQDWLEKFIFPAEAKNVNPEFCRWGTRLACLEMLLGGVTAYADMYYFEEVIAEVTREAGMRGVLGETIIQFPAPDAKTPEEGLKRTEAFLKRFRSDPWIVPAVGLEKQIGSIETGKRADLVSVRIGQPHAVPHHDVYSMLVYALKASDVQDVMIHGRPVVRDRKALTLDQAAILRKAEEFRRTISASLK